MCGIWLLIDGAGAGLLKVARLVVSQIPIAISEGVLITLEWKADGRVSRKAPVNRYIGTLEQTADGQIH